MTKHNTTAAALLTALALTGLTACREQADTAPEKLTGTITTVYGKDVVMPSGGKCTYGSFTVQVPDGTVYSVCAASKGQFTDAKVGDSYSRG